MFQNLVVAAASVRTVADTGIGHLQFPGGHLDVGEDYFACAVRETLEETGLSVKAEKFLALTNDVFGAAKHYITIFVLCRRVDETQQPKVCFCVLLCLGALLTRLKVMEPEKCESWTWKGWADVRAAVACQDGETKVFLPVVNLLKDHPDIESLIETAAATRTDS